jgi:hypothetical protein
MANAVHDIITLPRFPPETCFSLSMMENCCRWPFTRTSRLAFEPSNNALAWLPPRGQAIRSGGGIFQNVSWLYLRIGGASRQMASGRLASPLRTMPCGDPRCGLARAGGIASSVLFNAPPADSRGHVTGDGQY